MSNLNLKEATYFSGTANPVSKGGVASLDTRKGLGYGQTSNGGLGSCRDMGDALSSPKGEWDNIIDDLEVDDNEEKNKDDSLALDIEKKAKLSFNRTNVDPYRAKGNDISSLGGLANTVASVIGIHSGHSLTGDIVSENVLKDFIKETILKEFTMSGNLASKSSPKAKNTGGKYNRSVYVTDTTSGHANNMFSPNDKERYLPKSNINNRGYGQSRHNTTDGAETVYDSDISINLDDEEFDNMSSLEILNKTFSQNFKDNLNVLTKNKINKHI